MTHIRDVLSRAKPLCAAATLAFAAVVTAVPVPNASAAALTNRSLLVTSTAPSDETATGAGGADVSTDPGHPNNGTMVGHTYTVTLGSATEVDAVSISYCSSPFGYVDLANDCTAPAGFSAAAWDGASVSGTVDGSAVTFTAAVDDANYLVLTPSAPFTPAVNDVMVLDFTATGTDFFVNPSTAYIGTGAGQHVTGSYFAHVVTHSDVVSEEDVADHQADIIDEGTVTNNIANSITITSRVQETLKFSVQADGVVPAEVGATSCESLDSGLTALAIGDTNNALSAEQAYTGKSYFRLATNSAQGAKVFYSGETLTSGATNTITAIGAASDESTPGTEQFGLRIDTSDGNNDVGGAGVLVPGLAYGEADEYAFDDTSITEPKELASSPGAVACDTGAVEYVANISNDTEAGIYTTRINYIASPSY